MAGNAEMEYKCVIFSSHDFVERNGNLLLLRPYVTVSMGRKGTQAWRCSSQIKQKETGGGKCMAQKVHDLLSGKKTSKRDCKRKHIYDV